MSSSSPFYVGLGRLVIGWPDADNRRTIRPENDPHRVVGFVRHVDVDGAGVRYFAERPDRSPIEGTHRTRKLAVDALVDDLRERNP